jgi:hypothetical protein
MAPGLAGTFAERLLDLRPALSPHAQLGVSHRVRDGRFTPDTFSLRCARPFDSECVVKPWVAQVISDCDGSMTWRERFEDVVGSGAIDPRTTPAEFAAILPHFVENGILCLPERPLPEA